MTTAVRMRRHERHAANAQSFSPDGAKQILMAYRGQRNAAVAPGFEFRPGFIYTQVRAISARINQNFDGWPSDELKKSYRSFLGKPCFVNHQNFDPKKARGKVVAARYVEAGDDKYIETVMEIDAARFPKLAKEIKDGGLDSVSMGVEAGFTICSYCGNKAIDVPDFCEHVKYHKGQKLGRINEHTGAVEPVMVYEKCYKLGFFELSYVFDPADETSVVSRVIAANNRYAQDPAMAAPGTMPTPMMPTNEMPTELPPTELPPTGMMPTAALEARITRLAYGELEAPEDVDTLRDENDDGTNGFKNYVKSPKELQPPDMDQAKRLDRDQESEGLDANRRVEDVENISGPSTQGVPMPTRNGRRRGNRRYAEEGVGGPGLKDLLGEGGGAGGVGAAPHPGGIAGGAGPGNYRDYGGAGGFGDMGKTPGAATGGGGDHIHSPVGSPGEGAVGRNLFEYQQKGGRRYYAADEDDIAAMLGGGGPPPDDAGDAGPPPPPGGGSVGEGGQSDEELIQEAESDLQMAEQGEGGGEEAPPEEGGEEDMGDEGFPPEEGGDEDMGEEAPEEAPEEDGGDGLPSWLSGGGEEEEEDTGPPPPPQLAARRNGNRGGSTQKKRRATTKGMPMSLAQRSRVAAAQRPRNHYYADNSGHFDGGPYGENDQGESEGAGNLLSETPPAESVAVPTPGDGTISNTEKNLVARIQYRNAEQRRDLIAYEQITGRRLTAGEPGMASGNSGNPAEDVLGLHPMFPGAGEGFEGPYTSSPPSLTNTSMPPKAGRRLQGGPGIGEGAGGPLGDSDWDQPGGGGVGKLPGAAGGGGGGLEEGSLPAGFGPPPGSPTGVAKLPGAAGGAGGGGAAAGGLYQQHLHQGRRRYAEGVETPDEVHPSVNTGPGAQEAANSGEFESLGESPTETQPKDASVRAFRAFDHWLTQTTGKTARQHGNSHFIRRSAARFCSAKGWDPAVMFPALGNVLREARRNEGTNRRSAMRRYADDKLDVAAPQDRIDVEAPTSGTTDADAQRSQPDLDEFGDNAGDDLADPDLDVDTQIWAPGEGDQVKKSSNRKADGITAVRYAEAYIRAGLAPNTSEEKWKIAGLAQTMRLGTIRDRISVLDAVNAVTAQRQASARRTAGVNRGAGSSVPPGFGQRQLTAGTAREAANDIATDSAMFIK